MNVMGVKIDGYCVALILIILFFIYVDNDNIEGMSELGGDDDYKEDDHGDHADHDDSRVDFDDESQEEIGEVPHKIDMMPPPSMEGSLSMLQGASVDDGEDFMLIDDAFKGGLSVTEADLDTGSPRVGGPSNLGSDFTDELVSGAGAGGAGIAGISGAVSDDMGTSSSKDVKVVMVYAPWCGWSKKALPDFDKLINEYNGKNMNGWNVSVVKYNSDEREDMVKEYDVQGFPSTFVEINGERQECPREYEEQVSMIKEITSA